jgi:hypothetical protein
LIRFSTLKTLFENPLIISFLTTTCITFISYTVNIRTIFAVAK